MGSHGVGSHGPRGRGHHRADFAKRLVDALAPRARIFGRVWDARGLSEVRLRDEVSGGDGGRGSRRRGVCGHGTAHDRAPTAPSVRTDDAHRRKALLESLVVLTEQVDDAPRHRVLVSSLHLRRRALGPATPQHDLPYLT